MGLNDKGVAIGAPTKPIFRGEGANTIEIECWLHEVVMDLLLNTYVRRAFMGATMDVILVRIENWPVR
jgi:hypothetical protein